MQKSMLAIQDKWGQRHVKTCLQVGCLQLEVKTGRYITPFSQRLCQLCAVCPLIDHLSLYIASQSQIIMDCAALESTVYCTVHQWSRLNSSCIYHYNGSDCQIIYLRNVPSRTEYCIPQLIPYLNTCMVRDCVGSFVKLFIEPYPEPTIGFHVICCHMSRQITQKYYMELYKIHRYPQYVPMSQMHGQGNSTLLSILIPAPSPQLYDTHTHTHTHIQHPRVFVNFLHTCKQLTKTLGSKHSAVD